MTQDEAVSEVHDHGRPDYIVVGAGSSGAAAAGRLAQVPALREVLPMMLSTNECDHCKESNWRGADRQMGTGETNSRAAGLDAVQAALRGAGEIAAARQARLTLQHGARGRPIAGRRADARSPSARTRAHRRKASRCEGANPA